MPIALKPSSFFQFHYFSDPLNTSREFHFDNSTLLVLNRNRLFAVSDSAVTIDEYKAYDAILSQMFIHLVKIS